MGKEVGPMSSSWDQAPRCFGGTRRETHHLSIDHRGDERVTSFSQGSRLQEESGKRQVNESRRAGIAARL